jgi:hypothetical protein
MQKEAAKTGFFGKTRQILRQSFVGTGNAQIQA